METISAYEPQIRLAFFFGTFVLIALWEFLAPRRALTVSKVLRWTNNIGLVFLNTLILRLLFPAAAVGVALFTVEHGWGLLNIYSLSLPLAVFLSIVFMDLIIYLQHVLVHAVPALWRLHRVHHADLDYDVTTGARFHPIEIILSMLIKFATIVVLGPPVIAVIMFEIILSSMAMFNHGNIKLPLGLDKIIRVLLVTPDMHRVHHSVIDHEANSNFGFSLSIWDRLFGTYRDQPQRGHENMTIGINRFRELKQVAWLPGILSLPFKGKVTDYAINRRNWDDKKD
ncbi:MAG: sterol desaturase family protein [Gammaproteobacteria bacterium]|nr:sterol desaturase family protein [Gammaproteobacteria bacterium]